MVLKENICDWCHVPEDAKDVLCEYWSEVAVTEKDEIQEVVNCLASEAKVKEPELTLDWSRLKLFFVCDELVQGYKKMKNRNDVYDSQ